MPLPLPRRSNQAPHRPEMFEQWAVRFPKGNGAVASALTELVESYKSFREQHEKTRADQTSTEGARLVRSAKAARTKFSPLFERLDAAVTSAMELSSQLQTITAEAFNPPNKSYETCMRHQEIRSFVRGLPQGSRLKMLEDARKAKDEDTLIAVASCPPYLSGVAPGLHQYVRDQLIAIHASQEAEAIKSIGEQTGYAQQFRSTMLQSLADLIDFNKADELISAASTELAA